LTLSACIAVAFVVIVKADEGLSLTNSLTPHRHP